MKMTNKGKMFAGMLALAFVAYNLVLFVIAGFDHYASFWISYGFMILSFLTLAGAGFVLGSRGMFLRDWLFGYPLIKHTIIYIVCEFVVSTIFIIVDSDGWKLAFVLQFLLLAVYLVFAVSCFLAKTTIEEVKQKVAEKTQYIKLLTAEVNSIAAKCADAEAKAEIAKLADELRFSDPMSNEALREVEEKLAAVVAECNSAVEAGDSENAKFFCKKAANLLVERNNKCKALK